MLFRSLLNWRHDPQKNSYSFHKSKGGGVLVDFIHEPDYAAHVFGIPKHAIVKEKRLHNDVTIDASDSCMMLWEYENLQISFNLSYASKEYVRKAEILNEDGTSLTLTLEKNDIEESYKRQWQDIISTGPKNSYKHCVELYEKLLET